MGFGSKWRFWIKGCLNSSHASVIINGSPMKEFKISKCIRQGNPFSPLLFMIAREGLNVTVEAVKDKGLFKGVQIRNGGPILSELFYVDDTIFIDEW